MAGQSDWGETVADFDNLAPDAKKAQAAARATWYDLVCGECGRHCCVNCTADGDYTSCAQTMFTNCSVCGHASDGHYAEEH